MMRNRNISDIIKEEIHNFNFLSNDEVLKEQDEVNVLRSEDFQKRFIYDSIKNKNNIKLKSDESNISLDDDNLDIHVVYNIEYDFNGELLNFKLIFDADDLPFNVESEYERETEFTPSNRESWIHSVDWNDINVTLYSNIYDDIDFEAIDNAPNKIKELFIREYIEYDIINSTDVDIRN